LALDHLDAALDRVSLTTAVDDGRLVLGNFDGLGMTEQVCLLLAANEGLFDQVPSERVDDAKRELLAALKSEAGAQIQQIATGPKPTEAVINKILSVAKRALHSFTVKADDQG